MTDPRPTDDDWRRKVDALARLAKDQKGKPEGDVAAQKLRAIMDTHPEVFSRQTTCGTLRVMPDDIDITRYFVSFSWDGYQKVYARAFIRDVVDDAGDIIRVWVD